MSEFEVFMGRDRRLVRRPTDVRRLTGGLLTPAEVAALFGVRVAQVRVWGDSGKLRMVRTVGGHRRYFAVEVGEKLERFRDEGGS